MMSPPVSVNVARRGQVGVAAGVDAGRARVMLPDVVTVAVTLPDALPPCR